MNNTKFLWTVLIFLSLFIILLFTKEQIYSWQSLSEEKWNLIKKEQELSVTNWELTDISKKLDKESADFDGAEYSKIQKFSKGLKEDEIVNFIYSKIWQLNGQIPVKRVEIKSLKISAWQENLMKFLESNISLDLKVSSKEKLKEVLNLLNDNEEYRFFVTSLNFEDRTSENLVTSENWNEWIEVSIPLKIFYK